MKAANPMLHLDNSALRSAKRAKSKRKTKILIKFRLSEIRAKGLCEPCPPLKWFSKMNGKPTRYRPTSSIQTPKAT